MSEATDLATYRAALVAELAAGNIKPSYSIDGQSVDWNGYRMHLLQMIREVNKTLVMLEPFEIRTQVM